MSPPADWVWPDPALGPPRPGVRPHRHPPNRLPVWCLEQESAEHDVVLCDSYGNEHVVSHMAPDRVEAAIAYLRLRAPLLFGLRLADLRMEAIELMLLGLDGSEPLLERAERIETLGPDRSLEATLLMRSLRQRLRVRQRDVPTTGGGT